MKFRIVAVLVVQFIFLLSVGCDDDNRIEVEHLLKDIETAIADIERYQYEMTGSANMHFGDPDEGFHMNFSVEIQETGTVDRKNKRAKSISTTTVPFFDEKEYEEEYIIDGFAYWTESDSEIFRTWTREKWIDDESFNLLSPFVEIDDCQLLDEEILNETVCYVIHVEYDIATMNSSSGSLFSHPVIGSDDFEEGIEETTCTLWIAKDTCAPQKAQIEITGYVPIDAAVGFYQPDEIVTDMLVETTAVYDFHNINTPVTIELPDEAETAQDIMDSIDVEL